MRVSQSRYPCMNPHKSQAHPQDVHVQKRPKTASIKALELIYDIDAPMFQTHTQWNTHGMGSN